MARPDFPFATLELGLDDNPTANYYEATLALSPLGYWRLNESTPVPSPSATLPAYDSSGNGNNGIYTTGGAGGFTVGAAGALSGDPDTAVVMAGGAGVIVSGLAALSLTAGQYTAEGWIKRSHTGIQDQILLHGFIFSINNTDHLSFVNGAYTLTSTVTITDTNWHHVAFVAAGGRLFLDGALVAASGTNGPLVTGPTTFQVGGSASGSCTWDEIALYTTSLSDADVAAHYAAATIHTPIVWTDVSRFFVGGGSKRGRQHELDQIEAGTGTITVRNTDRRFDPTNAAGPYYGKLLPMRRLRLRWTAPANAVDIDANYKSLVLGADPYLYWRLDETSGSVLADSSGNARAGTLEGAATYAQPGALSGGTNTALGLAGGGDIFNSSGTLGLAAGLYTIEAWVKRTTPGHRDAIFWMGDSTTGVGVYLYFDTDDKLKFALGSGAAGVGLSVVATSSVTAADTNWHHVAFSSSGGSLYLDGVLVAAAGGSTAGVSAGTILRVGAGGFALGTVALLTGSIDEVTVYPSSLSASDILDHYRAGASGSITKNKVFGFIERFPLKWSGPNNAWVELTVVDGFEQLAQTDISTEAWGAESAAARINHVLDAALWPRSLRDIDTGLIAVPATAFDPASFTAALTHLKDVASAELGYFFISADGKATFHDRYHRAIRSTPLSTWGDAVSGFLPYMDVVPDYSKDRILNDVTSTADAGIAQRSQDGASIGKYFRRSLTRQPLITTDAEALLQSKLIVATHKDPGLRIEQLVIKPSTAAQWAQVLSREIGDVVTVRRQPPGGGSPIVQDCYIEAIQDSFPRALEWTATWQLTPVSAGISGWILGDSVYSILGDTTVLAA